ncbi:hypothetical protein [Thermodesulfobacterium hydrogeniphilum]|uniref:hypothetical protein n=1 Tax=Thermodesulfobacterium hydrogeniphilum TaxID=161156 RepID=UPI000570B054|nr:hypothetical protein [Thermodesulfobacterium hydrogeniphilum]
MKIDPKILNQINFNIDSKSLNRNFKTNFEDYLKVALEKLETHEFLQKSQEEKFSYIYQKLEESSKILENLGEKKINYSTSETIGDYLLIQALEINKLLETLPESSLKNLLKDWAFFIGIEAQKIKEGFYS